ncbi:MAG: hypothetical protein HQM08_03390 [Candidatus Riflebacteria bacterium]|nr:hypothetical protein [Candidatus Riflebacteria bacterium]
MILMFQFGTLDPILFGKSNLDGRGTDYFSAPIAFKNLLSGRSMYDTWNSSWAIGFRTWYLSHPAFAVFVASWFSVFPPLISLILWNIFSLILLGLCGLLIAFRIKNPSFQLFAIFFSMVSFPGYLMLHSGNCHAPLVLSVILILISFLDLQDNPDEKDIKKSRFFFISGILLSLFSKPMVLLMLPFFFLLPETRKPALKAFIIYLIVSGAFLIVPFLNPESIGLKKALGLFLNPSYVKENLNIYTNNFRLFPEMKDNIIHWLNLIAQSDAIFNHVQIFSLPSFVADLTGNFSPNLLFKVPILISLSISLMVYFETDRNKQLKLALINIIQYVFSYFLSYPLVWEYQYSSFAPILGFSFLLYERKVFPKIIFLTLLMCLFLISLPSLYFLFTMKIISKFWIIRSTRVIPTIIGFLALTIYIFYEFREQKKRILATCSGLVFAILVPVYSNHLNNESRLLENKIAEQFNTLITQAKTGNRDAEDQAYELAKNSGKILGLLDYSHWQYSSKNYEGCIITCQILLKIQSENAEAYNNISAAFCSKGDFEEGLKAGLEALRINPDFSLAKNNVGWAKKAIEDKKKSAQPKKDEK